MRAVVVRPPAPGAALEEVPAPPLADGRVLVDVLECGVCGTDRDIVNGKYGAAPANASYLILGHENLGRVHAVGAGVTGFAPGDLVVATVRRGCGKDRFCRANKSDECETGEFTERGIGGAHGYMAEQYTEVPEYLVHVPPALAPVAVLLEPLTVVEKAVFMGQKVIDRRGPTPGDPPTSMPTGLVAGTGAVGMLAAFLMRLRGYDVTAIDRHGDDTPAAALCTRVGAHHRSVANGIGSLQGATFDLVIEATGSVSLDFDLVDLLKRNGALVLTGIPDADQPPTAVPAGALLRNVVLENQAVVGSVNANRSYFETGLRDMAVFEHRWPGALGSMITARRPLEEFLPVITGRVAGSMKTVLTIAPGGAVAAPG
jgi:glucose 1-dehydrogenase